LLRRAKRRNRRSWKMKMKDVVLWRLNLDAFFSPRVPDISDISDISGKLDETMDEGPPPSRGVVA
jgi:hypothetical protein